MVVGTSVTYFHIGDGMGRENPGFGHKLVPLFQESRRQQRVSTGDMFFGQEGLPYLTHDDICSTGRHYNTPGAFQRLLFFCYTLLLVH